MESSNNPKDELIIDNQNDEGENYASLEDYFLDCCRFGDYQEAVDCLKDQEGIDVNYFDNNLNTALHMACANGHTNIVKEILEYKVDGKQVANINAKNSEGNTPLHWAVLNQRKDITELLIQNNAQTDIKNKFGKTALEDALEAGQFELGEVLAKVTKPDAEELIELEKESQDLQESNEADEDESDDKEESKEESKE